MIIPQTRIPGTKPLFEDPELIETLDQNHTLIRINKKVNWNPLVESFYKYYKSGIGRPILSIRLMIGLLLLQYIYELTDTEVVAQWEENIYYQAFTGQKAFVQNAPCH
jgi:IS5 family transposase